MDLAPDTVVPSTIEMRPESKHMTDKGHIASYPHQAGILHTLYGHMSRNHHGITYLIEHGNQILIVVVALEDCTARDNSMLT